MFRAAAIALLLPAAAFGQGTFAKPIGLATGVRDTADRAAVYKAIAKVYPSLVRIFVVTSDPLGGREVKHELSGSGTIISPDGFIVTNHHVAGRAQRVWCTLSNKEEIPADLVGSDALTDLAVIKLHPAKPRTFPAAHFGSSAALRDGDPILAMGSPLALSQSVTNGIVSNTQMIMPEMLGMGMGRLDGEDVGTLIRWIGHDAAIYPGNSGGPLVNMNGEIVGVNELSLGLAGAIPGDLAKSVVDAIIHEGRVRRSWTGIEVQPRLHEDTLPGALVSWVADKSPAAAAGIVAGDVLVRVGDAPVDARYAEQVPLVNQDLVSLPIGRAAPVVVRRAGVEKTLMVTSVERSDASSIPAELRAWGLVVSDLSPSEARELGRSSTDGVRIVSVRAGGPASQAKPPLTRDDIIMEVNGQPVHSVSELQTRTNALVHADSGKRINVLVGYDRVLERQLTVAEIGESTPGAPVPDARKAWVAVTTQVLTPQLADRLGLKGRTGVRVTRVLDDKTPLRVGDIILAIDGDTVRASSSNDDELFESTIRRYHIGQTVSLSVSRGGSIATVPVTLAMTRAPAREKKTYQDANFDFRARDLTDDDRDDPRLESVGGGVLVESAAEGGWAALAHLQGGDIIVAMDGRPVGSVDDLASRMQRVASTRPASVVFEIRRGIRTLFVEMEPTWR